MRCLPVTYPAIHLSRKVRRKKNVTAVKPPGGAADQAIKAAEPASAGSLSEILTVLIGRRHGPAFVPPVWIAGNPLALLSLDDTQMANELGVPLPQVRRIASALALHRHLQLACVPSRQRLATPEAVAQVLAPWCGIDHERFWCLPMDPRMRLIGAPIEVSRGDLYGVEAGPRLFYRNALRAGAATALAAHNHPTGVLSPSPADLVVTRRLAVAGRAVDCPLQDHLIVVPGGGFVSLRRTNPTCFR